MDNLFKFVKVKDKKSTYSVFGGQYLITKGKPDWTQGDGRFPTTEWHIYHADGTIYTDGFTSRDAAVSRLRTDHFLGKLKQSGPTIQRSYYMRSPVSGQASMAFRDTGKRWEEEASPGAYTFLMTSWMSWARPHINVLCNDDGSIARDADDNVYLEVGLDLTEDGHDHALGHFYSWEHKDCGALLDALPAADEVHVPTTPALLLKQFTRRQSYTLNEIIWDKAVTHVDRCRWKLVYEGTKTADGGAVLRGWMETSEGEVIAEASGKVLPPQNEKEAAEPYEYWHWLGQYRPVNERLGAELYDKVVAALSA